MKDNIYQVAIIGAGLMGGRRALALGRFPDNNLAMVASRTMAHARKLAAGTEGCLATTRWQDVVENEDIDIVVVCTPPNLHEEMSVAAMVAGKHVLCEKPLTRTEAEAESMVATAKGTGMVLKCGFNHRCHPAVLKAHEWVDAGAIGEINFMRCTYGIGGRPGYEEEWRADPSIVGGGQLMEQGIHGLDLFRWFLGDFAEATGFVSTRYWKIGGLEDNGFALFRTARGQIASLHSSLTRWKNAFNLEIFGQEGYIVIDGLGASYGTEKATLGRNEFFKPFRDETTEFRGGDSSWYEEWKEFMAAIREKREPAGNGEDGLQAIRMVNAVYTSSREGRTVKL